MMSLAALAVAVVVLAGAAVWLYRKISAGGAALAENKALRESIEDTRQRYIKDQERAIDDRIKTNQMESGVKKVKDYVEKLEDTDAELLSGADVERLRDLLWDIPPAAPSR